MSAGLVARGVGLAVGVMLGAAGGAAAQECAGGAEAVGWIGVEGLECNCTVRTGEVSVWSFRSEPRIVGIERGSAADGALRPGDEIVALNGDLITTSEAGRAYGALRPGEPLRLTVRRDGRLVDVTLEPAPICPDDPRAEPAAPRAIGAATAWTSPPARAPQAPPAPAAALPRKAPGAPMPPMAPPAPRLHQRGGWFGFGISCARCSWEMEDGDTVPRWSFSDYPRLMGVEEAGPAYEAGLRSGDVLLQIDGVDLRTEEGGRRFGAVEPGQRVRWTYRRGGSERTVEVRAAERPVAPELARIATMLDTLAARTRRGERVPADFLRTWENTPAAVAPSLPRTPAPDAFRTLRFRDTIGDVDVEVVGGPSVVTTIIEDGRDIVIDTGDARIRIRARGPGEPRQRD